MAYVKVDVSQVERLADDLARNAGRVDIGARAIVAKVGEDTAARAQELAPVDTGTLKSSISADIDGLVAEIGPTVEYGAYVEEGTLPHLIVADGGFLHFVDEGHDVYARVVHHPGTAPQPFMAPAADMEFPKAEEALGILGSRILD